MWKKYFILDIKKNRNYEGIERKKYKIVCLGKIEILWLVLNLLIFFLIIKKNII